MKKLALLPLAIASSLATAGTGRPISVSWTDGTVTRSLPVPAASYSDRDQILITEAFSNGVCTFKLGAQWVRFDAPCDSVKRDWVYPVVVPPPPPPGGFAFNLSPDQSSAAFQRFLAIVDSGDSDDVDATVAAFAYKFTGREDYRLQCLALADAYVTRAEQDIAAGRDPELAGDSYLYSGDRIENLAVPYAWCGPTATQGARYAALATQAVFNIWNPSLAHWGSRAAPWSGWSIDNAFNNYFYSFARATMSVGLGMNSPVLVKDGQNALQYTRSYVMPALAAAYATIPGGGSLEGTGYGQSHMTLFELYKWWKDSTGEDVTDAHMSNSIYFWLAATLPDSAHYWPIGSQARVSIAPINDYPLKLVELAYIQSPDQRARDAALFWFAFIHDESGHPYTTMHGRFMALWDLVNRSGTPTQTPALTYYAPEVGAMMGRTSWATNACWTGVLMGDFSESHAHPEQGGVSFVCGANAATITNNRNTDSGIWGEGGNGDAVNVVRFWRGSEEQRQQRYHRAVVNSYTPSPLTGAYSVLGDMSAFYGSGSGVSQWKRSVEFANGSVLVTDYVQLASGTTAKQQWNVFGARPTINQNAVTGGGVRFTVLAPASPQISIVDLHALNGDFHAGAYRIDIACGTPGCATRLDPAP